MIFDLERMQLFGAKKRFAMKLIECLRSKFDDELTSKIYSVRVFKNINFDSFTF